MNRLSGRDFLGICDEQGVELRGGLAPLLSFGDIRDWRAPTLPLQAVISLGRELNKDFEPYNRLATRPIEITPELRADVVAEALASLLNSQIGVEDETAELPNLRGDPVWVENCYRAENCFAETLSALNFIAEGGDVEQDGAQIIVGDDGEPLIIRKSLGEPSGLTLTEMVVNGARVVAGTILALTLRGGAKPLAEKVDVVPITKIKRVGVMRLSAFIFEPDEREQLYAEKHPHIAKDGFRTATIEDFHTAARHTVDFLQAA